MGWVVLIVVLMSAFFMIPLLDHFYFGLPLGKAAARGDLIAVKNHSRKHPQWINRTPDGSTPLHYAAMNGHLNVVEYLLTSGADPSIINEDGKTAADLAKSAGHQEIANAIEDRVPSDED